MSKRREFSKAVKVEIVKRATRENGETYCEACGLPCKLFEIHHLDMDAMQVDKSRKLTAADGKLLCIPCHDIETAKQAPVLAKARAREAAHVGVRTRPTVELKSAPFARTEKAIKRAAQPSKLDALPPRRSLYAEVKPEKVKAHG